MAPKERSSSTINILSFTWYNLRWCKDSFFIFNQKKPSDRLMKANKSAAGLRFFRGKPVKNGQ